MVIIGRYVKYKYIVTNIVSSSGVWRSCYSNYFMIPQTFHKITLSLSYFIPRYIPNKSENISGHRTYNLWVHVCVYIYMVYMYVYEHICIYMWRSQVHAGYLLQLFFTFYFGQDIWLTLELTHLASQDEQWVL